MAYFGETSKRDVSSPSKVGTCSDMCPPGEVDLRRRTNQVHFLERNPHDPQDTSLMVKAYFRTLDETTSQDTYLRNRLGIAKSMDRLRVVMDRNDVPFEIRASYIWDRARAVWKDMAMQRWTDLFRVTVLEEIARFLIFADFEVNRLSEAEEGRYNYRDDFNEELAIQSLNNCFMSLAELYEDLRKEGTPCPNEFEFRVYHLLLQMTPVEGRAMLHDDIQAVADRIPPELTAGHLDKMQKLQALYFAMKDQRWDQITDMIWEFDFFEFALGTRILRQFRVARLRQYLRREKNRGTLARHEPMPMEVFCNRFFLNRTSAVAFARAFEFPIVRLGGGELAVDVKSGSAKAKVRVPALGSGMPEFGCLTGEVAFSDFVNQRPTTDQLSKLNFPCRMLMWPSYQQGLQEIWSLCSVHGLTDYQACVVQQDHWNKYVRLEVLSEIPQEAAVDAQGNWTAPSVPILPWFRIVNVPFDAGDNPPVHEAPAEVQEQPSHIEQPFPGVPPQVQESVDENMGPAEENREPQHPGSPSTVYHSAVESLFNSPDTVYQSAADTEIEAADVRLEHGVQQQLGSANSPDPPILASVCYGPPISQAAEVPTFENVSWPMDIEETSAAKGMLLTPFQTPQRERALAHLTEIEEEPVDDVPAAVPCQETSPVLAENRSPTSGDESAMSPDPEEETSMAEMTELLRFTREEFNEAVEAFEEELEIQMTFQPEIFQSNMPGRRSAACQIDLSQAVGPDPIPCLTPAREDRPRPADAIDRWLTFKQTYLRRYLRRPELQELKHDFIATYTERFWFIKDIEDSLSEGWRINPIEKELLMNVKNRWKHPSIVPCSFPPTMSQAALVEAVQSHPSVKAPLFGRERAGLICRGTTDRVQYCNLILLHSGVYNPRRFSHAWSVERLLGGFGPSHKMGRVCYEPTPGTHSPADREKILNASGLFVLMTEPADLHRAVAELASVVGSFPDQKPPIVVLNAMAYRDTVSPAAKVLFKDIDEEAGSKVELRKKLTENAVLKDVPIAISEMSQTLEHIKRDVYRTFAERWRNFAQEKKLPAAAENVPEVDPLHLEHDPIEDALARIQDTLLLKTAANIQEEAHSPELQGETEQLMEEWKDKWEDVRRCQKLYDATPEDLYKRAVQMGLTKRKAIAECRRSKRMKASSSAPEPVPTTEAGRRPPPGAGSRDRARGNWLLWVDGVGDGGELRRRERRRRRRSRRSGRTMSFGAGSAASSSCSDTESVASTQCPQSEAECTLPELGSHDAHDLPERVMPRPSARSSAGRSLSAAWQAVRAWW